MQFLEKKRIDDNETHGWAPKKRLFFSFLSVFFFFLFPLRFMTSRERVGGRNFPLEIPIQ